MGFYPTRRGFESFSGDYDGVPAGSWRLSYQQKQRRFDSVPIDQEMVLVQVRVLREAWAWVAMAGQPYAPS